MAWIPVAGDANFAFTQGRTYRVVGQVTKNISAAKVQQVLSGPVSSHMIGPDSGGFDGVAAWDEGAPLPPDWPDVRQPLNNPDWHIVYLQGTRSGASASMPASYSISIPFVGSYAYRILSAFMDDGTEPVPPPHPVPDLQTTSLITDGMLPAAPIVPASPPVPPGPSDDDTLRRDVAILPLAMAALLTAWVGGTMTREVKR